MSLLLIFGRCHGFLSLASNLHSVFLQLYPQMDIQSTALTSLKYRAYFCDSSILLVDRHSKSRASEREGLGIETILEYQTLADPAELAYRVGPSSQHSTALGPISKCVNHVKPTHSWPHQLN
ncbi:hypothetical protein B0H16DRAFT_930524 [Mycena metata]|uniref:Uncharacterized protein n=1 Tax=Mycena metata TaxID=1033252 RepID=A0AAD7IR04_9AGAR|nr:hypothetical protein B0H16DRAFT_930524 [Mycena metata]